MRVTEVLFFTHNNRIFTGISAPHRVDMAEDNGGNQVSVTITNPIFDLTSVYSHQPLVFNPSVAAAGYKQSKLLHRTPF